MDDKNAGITKLTCKNFRSYRTLALNISSMFVVFHGENGAGKTNILEAISLFSSERGLRKAPVADLNCIGSSSASWNVELLLKKDDYKTQLSTNAQNGRRVARIDGTSASSLSKFEESLWLLWIVPGMDNLFINSMSDRRAFFDHLVSGYEKRHKSTLRKLADLQKERLHVIFHRKDESWLSILEERIAEENVKITKSRLEFIDLLHKVFDAHPSEFLRPIVSISGEIEKIYRTHSEEDSILEIMEILKRNRYIDSEKQTTSVSAQKSIWEARHRKTSLEAENCSTGEQKAFLISLVLAVFRIYKRTRTGIPILLLDDLMVHLDEKRRRDLATELTELNVQTFFTGTDRHFFKDILPISQVYHVEKSICSMQASIKQ
ncbi:DNA replication and repair protein RecF [Alphaproteobacteria bacterium]|nr:DNA replication and repair protein RecF [Alphaproteobacteria bacterium]